MRPLNIIEKYYERNSLSYKILVTHVKLVTKKALKIAKNSSFNPDLKFIEEAAMLHDIGIFLTNAPEIGCLGKKPYICHGTLGRTLLEKENLPKHALVCERHTGVGLSVEDIEKEKFPIPKRDMNPKSVEEEIICIADKFYSKNPETLTKEKTVEEIREELSKYGKNTLKKLNYLLEKYNLL